MHECVQCVTADVLPCLTTHYGCIHTYYVHLYLVYAKYVYGFPATCTASVLNVGLLPQTPAGGLPQTPPGYCPGPKSAGWCNAPAKNSQD